MRIFFIVCAVLGTIGAIGLFVMLLGFRVKVNLGFTLPKGKTIPIEKFIPQTIYGYTVFIAVIGYVGLLLYPLDMPWFFLVPILLMSGMIVNFIGAHFLLPAFENFWGGKKPAPEEIEGVTATAIENISGDGYGRVRIKRNDRKYIYDCISVYHTDIMKGEEVTVITGEGELLFVQKQDEIFEVLKEENQNV